MGAKRLEEGGVPTSGAGSANKAQRQIIEIDGKSNCIYILTMITWDETKRRENIRKHGLDLADLESVFDLPMISVEDARQSYGELRLQSLGLWQGRVVFLVWTPRGDETAHIISCRYADRKETDVYFNTI
jgi:uncharacterized protein